MRRLNYNHLYYFHVIAQEGSIKKASKKLFLTQPTLSDQLKNLEEFLSVKLFERRNRQLFLTPEGQTAFQYTSKIFSLGNEFVRKLTQKTQPFQKSIKVGIVPSLSKTFTYRLLIPIFEKKDIQIKVKEANLKYLTADLETGDIDLILCDDYDFKKSPHYEYIEVGSSRYYAVSGKKHSDAKKGFPQSLNKIPFFHYTEETQIRHEIDHFLAKNEVYPSIIGEANDINFLRIVTEKNQCFSILPEKTIRTPVKKNKLYILGEIKSLKTSVSIVYSPNNSNEDLKELTRMIKKAAKESYS